MSFSEGDVDYGHSWRYIFWDTHSEGKQVGRCITLDNENRVIYKQPTAKEDFTDLFATGRAQVLVFNGRARGSACASAVAQHGKPVPNEPTVATALVCKLV